MCIDDRNEMARLGAYGSLNLLFCRTHTRAHLNMYIPKWLLSLPSNYCVRPYTAAYYFCCHDMFGNFIFCWPCFPVQFVLITNLTHTCIPDGHLQGVIYTTWCIDTIDSPDDEHWVARNMWRNETNTLKNASSLLLTRNVLGWLSSCCTFCNSLLTSTGVFP
jgi:hypothetical protein